MAALDTSRWGAQPTHDASANAINAPVFNVSHGSL